MHIAIIAITKGGARVGAQLRQQLPESSLFVIDKHASGEALSFSGGLQPLVNRVWAEFEGLVFIMATGIVVRTIAHLLDSKDRDPAVVVMDDTGRFAVSLLSGHIGGANELALLCGEVTGSLPVITTATDVNGLPSFDMLAKEQGWQIEDLSRVKLLNALLLEAREIAVVDPTGMVRRHFAGRGNLTFYASFGESLASEAVGFLFVTNRVLAPEENSERLLVLRPKNLCIGIGCNRGTSREEIESVVAETLAALSLSAKSVSCVATAEAKQDEEGLVQFVNERKLPLVCFSSNELNDVATPSPTSQHAFEAIGAKGVAEPAALLASGGGQLLLNKIKSGNVTIAIASKII